MYVRKRVQRAIWVVIRRIVIAAGAPDASPLALRGANGTTDGRTTRIGAGDHSRTGGGGGSVGCRRGPSGADGGRGLWQDRAGGKSKGGAGSRGSGGARDRWAVASMGMGAVVMRRTSARACGWGGWMW